VHDDLEKIRDEIDGIDSHMLRLLNRRMELAIEVGRIKAFRGLQLFHPERERIVSQRLSKLNPGPLSEESLRSIYREIFAASRLIQHRLQAALPGPEGTQSPFDESNRQGAKAKNQKVRICGCLAECPSQEFGKWLNHPEVDLVEWRMDRFFAGGHSIEEEMKSFLETLSARPRLPVIATNRPVREMGGFAGREDLRLSMLEQAAKSGVDWIDFEHDADMDYIAHFRQAGAKVLISWHNPVETPSMGVLCAKLESMLKTGPDALKIVTLAKSDVDNLRVAELIPVAREEFGIDLIAFCMGPAGKWSRLVSLLLGSPWTYVRFDGQSASAPGQFTVSEMRALVRFFGKD